ncbi:unnamed protein product [Spirodela intermedia]|uniref:Bifunctional inhibitor/plant lipid transfer protein/seed storage helical domain-containing protein n=2 Tax=Spirodela intermedia TaxID=51605 RepID=A0A7I8L924_SPIIN|nr:unnamed protein product [Spirodela intermedia]CAA6669574.1 unnamed protein product [Spirodela intermedia]CAA7406543.1 unnamed protein product [Spirodela intermedia]
MVVRMVMVTAAVVLLMVTGAPPVRAAVDVPACLQPLVSLRSCLDDVSKNPAARSPACCSFFVQLLNATPNCLCDVLEGEGGRWLAITIDVARAVAVLVNCSAEIPKLTKCPTNPFYPLDAGAPPLASLSKLVLVLSLAASAALAAVRV